MYIKEELPKVSVITVVYNRAESIGKTIEDTLRQTYTNLEYIVVDGGSTDGTTRIIRKYSDKLIWLSEPDNGIYDAMMKGARMATGEWLIFRNAGDYFYSQKVIDKVFSEYEDHGEDLIIGGTRYFVNYYYTDRFVNYPQKSYFETNSAHHTSTFIRRTTQLKYPYPAQYHFGADNWFFINVLKNGGTYYKTSQIVALYDNRTGATADHYDMTLQDNLAIYKSFNAPKEIIEKQIELLDHCRKVKKRKKHRLWALFYKFTRWYYGYRKEEWHRYARFSDLFDREGTIASF